MNLNLNMMETKFQIFIIFNIFIFLLYKLIIHFTKIKGNYDKWNDFYEKYNTPPFSYIANLLPFSPDDMFFKISNFAKTLSFYIYNTGYNIDDFDEEEFHLDIINNTKQYIETNITKYNMNDIDTMYDDYFNHSINEISILEDSIINENIINIKPILENGFNKNKIIILFIFFIQQIQIFQMLERNFNLNKIYYFQRNKTSIEELELYHENLFNYENNLEIILFAKQFVEYHKDFGFFSFEELKKEKMPIITKSEKNFLDLFIHLKYMNKDEYKNLNDFELSNYLSLFERTVKSINYLGMANSLYTKATSLYNKDLFALRLGFIVLSIFVNSIILIHYSEDDKINYKKKKKYK